MKLCKLHNYHETAQSKLMKKNTKHTHTPHIYTHTTHTHTPHTYTHTHSGEPLNEWNDYLIGVYIIIKNWTKSLPTLWLFTQSISCVSLVITYWHFLCAACDHTLTFLMCRLWSHTDISYVPLVITYWHLLCVPCDHILSFLMYPLWSHTDVSYVPPCDHILTFLMCPLVITYWHFLCAPCDYLLTFLMCPLVITYWHFLCVPCDNILTFLVCPLWSHTDISCVSIVITYWNFLCVPCDHILTFLCVHCDHILTFIMCPLWSHTDISYMSLVITYWHFPVAQQPTVNCSDHVTLQSVLQQIFTLSTVFVFQTIQNSLETWSLSTRGTAIIEDEGAMFIWHIKH